MKLSPIKTREFIATIAADLNVPLPASRNLSAYSEFKLDFRGMRLALGQFTPVLVYETSCRPT